MPITRSTQTRSLIISLQDAKVLATESDWLALSIRLTQQLADADHPEHADVMRRTGSLDGFRTVCADVALDLFRSLAA